MAPISRSVGKRDEPLPVPHGRGEEVKHGGGPGQRTIVRLGRKPRDIYIPARRIPPLPKSTLGPC